MGSKHFFTKVIPAIVIILVMAFALTGCDDAENWDNIAVVQHDDNNDFDSDGWSNDDDLDSGDWTDDDDLDSDSNAPSIERDYNWYFSQIGTGSLEGYNCGPAVSVMALKWYDENFNDTVADARNALSGTGDCWIGHEIISYLESHGVFGDLRAPLDQENATWWLERDAIMLAGIYTGDISFRNDDSAIGRYYTGSFDHWIIIKGLYSIDGVYHFEVYDPWAEAGDYYTDGTPKGLDRLYPAEEVIRANMTWADKWEDAGAKRDFIAVLPPQ